MHVCGEHASWRDVTPEEFITNVDVASEPTQINDYLRLDWALVVTDKMSLEQLSPCCRRQLGNDEARKDEVGAMCGCPSIGMKTWQAESGRYGEAYGRTSVRIQSVRLQTSYVS
ncbi:MAG: hypothetical protein P3W87_001115 [Gammaproteobacteria bacterium]|nr:hypothetical protein [Gammaproteobacteria bacterium]